MFSSELRSACKNLKEVLRYSLYKSFDVGGKQVLAIFFRPALPGVTFVSVIANQSPVTDFKQILVTFPPSNVVNSSFH